MKDHSLGENFFASAKWSDRTALSVLFHDILYSCYHDILYTAARAERVRQGKASAGERARMAWRTMAVRHQRVEFVVRVQQGQENLSQLCAEFGISRPTGYVWLQRYRQLGVAGIEEHSRRPRHSPRQTAAPVEQRIVELRRELRDAI